MTLVNPIPEILTEMQSIGCSATKTWLTNSRKMNDDEAFCQLRAHAGYVYPDLFVDYYIRNTSYQLLALKDFHIEILNAIKPGVYGKQINVQAPRGTGKTTLVNGLIPLWRICYKHFDLVMDSATRRIHPHCRSHRTHGVPTHNRNPPSPLNAIPSSAKILATWSAMCGRKKRPTPRTESRSVRWVAVRHLVAR